MLGWTFLNQVIEYGESGDGRGGAGEGQEGGGKRGKEAEGEHCIEM